MEQLRVTSDWIIQVITLSDTIDYNLGDYWFITTINLAVYKVSSSGVCYLNFKKDNNYYKTLFRETQGHLIYSFLQKILKGKELFYAVKELKKELPVLEEYYEKYHYVDLTKE